MSAETAKKGSFYVLDLVADYAGIAWRAQTNGSPQYNSPIIGEGERQLLVGHADCLVGTLSSDFGTLHWFV